MTKVRLKTIALHNFKAVHDAKFDFDGRNAVISGRNGSGKTTVYEAYYWCLFGKTLAPNGVVQTLDKNNEVIHKVDTIVEVVLNVDNEYDVSIRRTVMEDWKAKNTPDEKLTGTKVQRFWNDVPVSMAEYKKKLNAIIPIAQWQMLSNNSAFMACKADDRRKMLLSIAGQVNDEELMKPFPAVLKAIAERKTIEELNAQTKNARKSANKELNEIPAKIAAQDALKVESVAEDATSSTEMVEAYFAKEKSLKTKIEDFKATWRKNQDKNLLAIFKQRIKCEDALRKAQETQQINAVEQQRRAVRLADVTEQFNQAKSEWFKINDENFDFELSETCPVCGAPLSEEFKANKYQNAVAEYNKAKSARLDKAMKKAQELSQQKTVLRGSIKAYNDITKAHDKEAVEKAKAALDEVASDYENDSQFVIENDSNYKLLVNTLSELQKEKPANSDDIVKLKADMEINRRVEQEKSRLQKRSSELSQIIADCDNVLYQIFSYKKAKIDAVEDKVNTLFSLVSWKFYQQNITNEDLQEVCICIVDGVDFSNLNTANKVNASIDIINGISKAVGVEVPCWIDNQESVSQVIHSEQQQIMLKVVDGQPLAMNYFNK